MNSGKRMHNLQDWLSDLFIGCYDNNIKVVPLNQKKKNKQILFSHNFVISYSPVFHACFHW